MAEFVGADIRNRRDFELELARLGEDMRRTIELECEAFPVDADAARARRERARTDYRFFCQTYFPHYVPTPHFSAFHEFIFQRLPEVIDGQAGGREVHQAPRGEAKSTYETQLGTLWCIVTGRKHMIGIIMNTEEQAAEMLESIKAELDTNPRLASDFPDACGQGRLWQATTVVTANNIKIRIGGTGKKIRGMKHGPYRPDLIFLDDLENDENVRDKKQRDKVEKFVLTAVVGLAGPAGGLDIFWVGTSLHYDAAINRVSRKPGWRRRVFRSIDRWPDDMALWEKWEAIYTAGADSDEAKAAAERDAAAFYREHRAAMDAGAVVSWPQVRPLYRLMRMRATDHDAFSQEQQNEAGNDDAAPFRTIHFWVDRRPEWLFFGAIDPSLGKQGPGRDPSAILVGGLHRESMTLDVVEADIARRVPDLIIARAIDLQRDYHCLAWGIETVQFQEFMYTELLKRAAAQGLAFPGIAMPETVDKSLRIVSLQPYVSRGQIRLHRSQSTLIEQLKFWPEADHDDGPDALEKLWRLATQFGCEWDYTPVRQHRHARAAVANAFTFGDGWEDD
ncbi:MAG: phage terminase large subunit [Azoarcus sp.]|jgi:predicted phage terminase large subunit-like protein|nr:phage terminase large subunit [Azoarcus sp.]